MRDPYKARECEQCYEDFTPERRGQRLCPSCRMQERDALERRGRKWEEE
jgi:Zn finger protein HypA/HybF involved in hydrogenase expression